MRVTKRDLSGSSRGRCSCAGGDAAPLHRGAGRAPREEPGRSGVPGLSAAPEDSAAGGIRRSLIPARLPLHAVLRAETSRPSWDSASTGTQGVSVTEPNAPPALRGGRELGACAPALPGPSWDPRGSPRSPASSLWE